jgi:hypothetical protein
MHLTVCNALVQEPPWPAVSLSPQQLTLDATAGQPLPVTFPKHPDLQANDSQAPSPQPSTGRLNHHAWLVCPSHMDSAKGTEEMAAPASDSQPLCSQYFEERLWTTSPTISQTDRV